MARKTSQINVTLMLRFPKFVGYGRENAADILITRDKDVPLTLKLTSDPPLLIPIEREIPPSGVEDIKSSQQNAPTSIQLPLSPFSPLFLAECSAPTECHCTAAVFNRDEVFARENFTVTALPCDWWEGLCGDVMAPARFVRPHLPACEALLRAAFERMRVWGYDPVHGYTDRNAARELFAAVYSALKRRLTPRGAGNGQDRGRKVDGKIDGEDNFTAPTFCSPDLKEGAPATKMQLAIFACSCLEAADLHPVLAIGEKDVGVGIWLLDSCFLSAVTREQETVFSYLSADHLAFFDADDLFSDKKGAFSVSAAHFMKKIDAFEVFLDIHRCRLEGISPCPTRGDKGELLADSELFDAPPAPLPHSPLPEAQSSSPCRAWERELLDLSGKDPLIRFTEKRSLRILSADADALLSALKIPLRLMGRGANDAIDPQNAERQWRELILLEQKNGILRTDASEEDALTATRRLLREGKEAEEETGAHVICLCLGFLHYVHRGERRRAPLLLSPVTLEKKRGREEILLTGEGEFSLNAALCELLEQEFGIDLGALKGDISALKPSEVFAHVRSLLPREKGWRVVDETFLAALSFERFLLWKDLHTSAAEFAKNPLFRALSEGKPMRKIYPAEGEDDRSPCDFLLPLPYDSSQFSAIGFADMGASFVLHGPPGTGKSQTIANIIANALFKGKRVLFVAEKRAALDVVRKRLCGVGIGEFCLALYGEKGDRAEAKNALSSALALVKGKEADRVGAGKELLDAREALRLPHAALHRIRQAGLSVHDAILGYFKNSDAGELLDISPRFFDGLTKESLAAYRAMILSAATAAEECGEICGSPFEGIRLTEYTPAVRDRLYCALETLAAECRHVKSLISLFCAFYRQHVFPMTEQNLRAAAHLAETMNSGVYDGYFSGADEGEFSAFFAANRELDSALGYYFKHFTALVESDLDETDIAALRAGEDRKGVKGARGTEKRLLRAARLPLAEEDIPKFLILTFEIAKMQEKLAAHPLSAPFCDRGKLNFKKRGDYLKGLYALHEDAAALFPEYAPEAFNAMCLRTKSAAPLLMGVMRAVESFSAALEGYFSAANADGRETDEDVDFYLEKAVALLENIDMLPNWCAYRAAADLLEAQGLSFVPAALERGNVKSGELVAGFEKSICKRFSESVIAEDGQLRGMTAGTNEGKRERFRLANDLFMQRSREALRNVLISRLAAIPDEERAMLAQNLPLRTLFERAPRLLALAAPCMLMSPTTAARYLQPKANMFDLVIFDEASQMTTAEAVGAIARGKAAIIVGDPKQLPPTPFFRAEGENCRQESILDSCLALGMPERRLLWHYRSRHDSLIAFSNGMYYDGRLCTFPSAARESRVHFIDAGGVYDRGGSKRNQKEAECITEEILRRLKDPVLCRMSMGVVTFSAAQQEEISHRLDREIAKAGLEAQAYGREEPIFVKNLENVQGDERDVILISVCYGPDASGKLSMSFGPINRADGWRRLNVAVSRAREEMLVYASMTAEMIDLKRSAAQGTAQLKAFLEYAKKGTAVLAAASERERDGLGEHIARALTALGYECRTSVGTSDIRVDVAVIDPEDRRKYLLGILCDGDERLSTAEREMLLPEMLKKGGWEIVHVSSVNYFLSPKREIGRIREALERRMGKVSRAETWLRRYVRRYRAVKETRQSSAFLTDGKHDGEIRERLLEIVAMEQPLSRSFLKKRCLQSFGLRGGGRAERRLDALIDECAFKREMAAGEEYLYRSARRLGFGRVRVEGDVKRGENDEKYADMCDFSDILGRGNGGRKRTERVRRSPEDVAVYDMLSLVKGALEEHTALYLDELTRIAAKVFGFPLSDRLGERLSACIDYGTHRGLLARSPSDRITLR